jgi:glycosidase
VLDLSLQQQLAAFCHTHRPDFWLLGEVVHGDYRRWVNSATLESVTNYEVYKGLYSSHNDHNYFEIAYSLNRQFGPTGIYRGLPLYTFVDNHDVDRVASRLNDPVHLYPLHALLFTIPGIPSLYYGSEWGIAGHKSRETDAPLRPALTPATMIQQSLHPDLAPAIRRLSAIRQAHPALRAGDYRQLAVTHEQLAFLRSMPEEQVLVLANAAHQPIDLRLELPALRGKHLVDLINPGRVFPVEAEPITIPLDPCWVRICLVS